MRLLIVGATGGLGRMTASEAARRGHEVTALVRDPARAELPADVIVVRADVLDPPTLPAAVAGQDSVICVLGTPGPRQRSTPLGGGTANLVAAMTGAGVPRLVCVTMLGTGGTVRNASPFYRYVILRVIGPMLPDKEEQERVIRESSLEWVIVRPPRFTDGGRGALRVLRDGDRGRVGHVGRGRLAAFLVDAAQKPDHVRQALVVGS